MVEVVRGTGATGQAMAAQVSSPRAREERTTGDRPAGVVAAQPGQEALHHAAVDRAQDRVAGGRVPNGHCSATTAVAVPWSSAWAAKPWAVRVSAMARMAARTDRWPSPGAIRLASDAAVVLADLGRHRLGRLGAEQLQGPRRADQQVVAPGEELDRRVVADREKRLDGRPAPLAARPVSTCDVAAGHQTVEVVAGHVGVERERVATSVAVIPGWARTWRKISRRVGSPKAAVTAATTAAKRVAVRRRPSAGGRRVEPAARSVVYRGDGAGRRGSGRRWRPAPTQRRGCHGTRSGRTRAGGRRRWSTPSSTCPSPRSGMVRCGAGPATPGRGRLGLPVPPGRARTSSADARQRPRSSRAPGSRRCRSRSA